MSNVTFHVPKRPYDLIAAINRCAAATGSPSYAMATAGADYNGHHVTVEWNEFRRFYVTEHWWGGRVVHCRGSATDCVRAALREYDRGALGASVVVSLREEDVASVSQEDLARLTPGVPVNEKAKWYSGLIEHALRTNTVHLLLEADKATCDNGKVYRELVHAARRESARA